MPNRLRYVFAGAAVCLLPALLTLLLVSAYLGADLRRFTPAWNDEFLYWRQVYTFSQVGFNGGYYTMDEQPARAAFTRFYAHGPVYPLLLGTLARVIGWYPETGPFLNLALIGAALALWIRITRPDLAQLGWAAALLLVCWPMLLYIPSVMQESLHQAMGIVLAAGFALWLRRADGLTRHWRWALGAFIMLAALLRPTWSLLFLPYFLLSAPAHPGAAWGALVKGGALIGVSFALFQYWSAPYPYGWVAEFTRQLSQSPPAAARLLVEHFVVNLRLISLGDPLEIVQRLLLLGLTAAFLLTLSRSRLGLRLSRALFAAPRPGANEASVHLFNVGGILLLTLLIYDVQAWRDYRVLAPHLLLSALLLVGFNRRRWMALIVLAQAALLGAFLTRYANLHGIHFSLERAPQQAIQAQTEALLVYDPAAPSGWCSTLLSNVDTPPHWLLIHPGLGFSLAANLNPDSLPDTVRSRYLLLNAAAYDLLRDRLPLRRLLQNESYYLALNESAACPD